MYVVGMPVQSVISLKSWLNIELHQYQICSHYLEVWSKLFLFIWDMCSPSDSEMDHFILQAFNWLYYI